jgi:L-ascorbate metabolism protein UlaG (beta-lactamase superfamily)
MHALPVDLTLVGGPAVLIEIAGARLLPDPTFDPPVDYPLGAVTLKKTGSPALSPEALRPVDAVLLSHGQHPDNFDRAGRGYSHSMKMILTTPSGAERIGHNAVGLAHGQPVEIIAANGVKPTVIATAERHGPHGAERMLGELTGFVIEGPDEKDQVYVTGDTVYYECIAEVARRHDPKVVIFFAGAAKTRGAFHLTMNNNDVLETAAAFPRARIVVVHNDSWAHFTETADDVADALHTFGKSDRLTILKRGERGRLLLVD